MLVIMTTYCNCCVLKKRVHDAFSLHYYVKVYGLLIIFVICLPNVLSIQLVIIIYLNIYIYSFIHIRLRFTCGHFTKKLCQLQFESPILTSVLWIDENFLVFMFLYSYIQYIITLIYQSSIMTSSWGLAS